MQLVSMGLGPNTTETWQACRVIDGNRGAEHSNKKGLVGWLR